MASFFLNGLVLILVLGLRLASSSVINDPYPSSEETDTLADITDDLIKLDEMDTSGMDTDQLEDNVAPNAGQRIKAAFEDVRNSCLKDAQKEIPKSLISKKRRAYQRSLRKSFQILQHGKRSTVDDLSWLKAKQKENCVIRVLARLCANLNILTSLNIPSSWSSKKKVRQCKLKVLRLAKNFKYPDAKRVKCDKKARFRTIDGTCNNLGNPRFGATMTKFIRLEPAAYGDCVSTLRRAMSGDELPNARNVSRFVHGSNADRTNPDSPRLTHLTMNWGQFMDHDVTLAQAQNISCEPPTSDPECINIEVPLDDAIFQSRKVTFFELERDAPHKPQTSMCELSSREHTNTITAYVDASNVYGSSEEEEENLRAPGGLLRVMKHPHGCPLRNLLPAQDPEISCVSRDPNRPCFVAGDERVNENQGLMSVHTLLVREHNRIATFFGQKTDWDAERIYQETRRIIGAVLQVITYKEFLPLILSAKRIKSNNLLLLKGENFFNGYNPGVNAQISQAFSTAAYRFGHSLVQEEFSRFSQDGLEHKCDGDSKTEFLPIPVLDFGNPIYLYEKCQGGVDSIFRGLIKDSAAKADGRFSSSVQENLFRGPGDLSDLISINIQRGRERGVPSYTTYRNRPECKITPKVKTFDDLKNAGFGQDDINKLRSQYQSVHDIDLFVGGMVEAADPDGGVLGPTFQCLIAEQFKRLRVGDRFWHENAPNPKLNTDKTAFTSCQLREIRKVQLARIICDNTDDIPAVTRKPLEQSKIFTSCNKLPAMNLDVFTRFKCQKRGGAKGDAPEDNVAE